MAPADFSIDLINAALAAFQSFWSANELRSAGLGHLLVREGTHRLQGIFVLSPAADVQLSKTVAIAAVAPTALGLLGLPVPGDCDGEPLAGADISADASVLKQGVSPKSVYNNRRRAGNRPPLSRPGIFVAVL